MNLLFRLINCITFLLLFSFALSAGTQDEIKVQIENYKSLAGKYASEGNKGEESKYLTRLGYLYWQIGALQEAVSYFERSLDINKSLNNQNPIKTIYNNLGLIYTEKDEFQQAITYFEKSLQINNARGDKTEAVSDLINIALSFQSLGYYAESNMKAEKALESALGINNLELSKTCYGILADNYEKLGDGKKASEYYEKFNTLSKHLQKKEMEDLAGKTKQIEMEVQSKEKELKSTLDNLGEVLELNRETQLQNALLSKENQLKEEQNARLEAEKAQYRAREKTRRTRFIALSIGFLLTCCIIGMAYWQLAQKKKANQLLLSQNAEIDRQKKEIEEQRDLANKQKKKITDSIQYAQRIQNAVLPPTNFFNDNFSDYFIMYRPKDIVSGDFYWTTRKDDVIIIAVADCTGHGVPGAFMSMLGVAYLNEIVNKIAINKHISTLNADDILNQLREMIISSLHQTGDSNEPKDGMDISLCIMDFERKKLQYAGANNPLYIIRKGELIQIESDKMPVSYHQKRDIPFTKHEMDLLPDDRIYMFSDGYIDQFGGDQGMKFLGRRFRETLLKIHSQTMEEQYLALSKALDDWKGNRPQLDDILVLGIRYFPRKSAKQQTRKNDWHKKTILIAEDTDVNYFLLTAVLKETNAKLVRVKDGLEAVDFVRNNDVDLILMDINMPRMNGYEATREIKSIRKDIPIIVQTAMHFEDENEEAFKAGADDYIAKPIDLKSFMGKMEQFL